MNRIADLGAVVVVLVLGAAACGGGGARASSGPKKIVHARSSTAPVATLRVADTSLGKIVVDTSGRTLYESDRDTSTASACTGACASLWPALTVSGNPHAGSGIDATNLGTAGTQVTYGQHLLYTFANDHAPGDVNGQGLGGVWWVVGPDGQKISTATGPSIAPSTAAAPTAAPRTTTPAVPATKAPATSPRAPAPTPPATTTAPPTTAPPTTRPTTTTSPTPASSPGTGGVAF